MAFIVPANQLTGPVEHSDYRLEASLEAAEPRLSGLDEGLGTG